MSTNGSNQRIGGFKAVYSKPGTIFLGEPDRISICTGCPHQQIVEYRLVTITQPYGDDPSIRQTTALDHPTRRIMLLLSGNPSCDSKKDVRHPVYMQAFGRFVADNVSTDLLDFSGDLRRELR
jgi:hypothetical protein